MKQFILLCMMILVGVLGWHFGSKLSSDAVSMGIGVLFGVMAGVPAALMVLASARRRGGEIGEDEGGAHRGQYGGYGQPPVIVVTGSPQGMPMGQNPHMLNSPQSMYGGLPHDISLDTREFKVVGEKDQLIDEW